MKSGMQRRVVLVGLAAAIAALILFLSARESSTEKEIRLELTKLRAAGEPTTAAELAEMFPDPPAAEDAQLAFGPVFEAIDKLRPFPANPLAQSTWNLSRTQPITPASRDELAQFVTATRRITNAWPTNVSPQTRFAKHWARGMTNSSMNFLSARLIAQLLAAHALSAGEDNNREAAASSLEKGFQFSTAVNWGASGEHMIRHAVENLLCKAVERILGQSSLPKEKLVHLNAAIQVEPESAWVDMLRVQHCHYLWAFDYVQQGGDIAAIRGFVRFEDREPFWKRWLKWIQSAEARKPSYADSDYLLSLKMIPQSIHLAGRSPAQCLPAAKALHAAYESNIVSHLGAIVSGDMSLRNPESHFESMARLRALKTALALEVFLLSHPGAPEEMPANLRGVDPFDDQPLRVKRLPRGYVVYSIGADFVDDGGKERAGPRVTAGYDVTITVER